MFSVDYVRAQSLDQAKAFLASHPDAKLLAGGMTLIPTLKQRLAQPSHLLDIAGLAELKGITLDATTVRIGAATKHHEVARSDVVRKTIPALAAAADLIGDPQVRNLGTMGGSLANNDPAADYPAAALGLGATIVTDRRSIPADDYFQGMFQTALEDGEIVVRIDYPLPQRAAYMKFPHPASGFAMTGAFVAVTRGGVRVAITGAGPGVFRWTAAEAALTARLDAAALEGLPLDESGMNEDIHGTRAYRANLVRVMTKRALAKL